MEIYQARKISNIPTAISQPFDFVCSHNEKFKIKDIGVCSKTLFRCRLNQIVINFSCTIIKV